MSNKTFFFLTVVVLSTKLFFSCEKKPCEDCENQHRSPVAKAGSDILITLPVNTITLNGNATYDLDGNIIQYLWTKLSGGSCHIASPNQIKTEVTNLEQGAYQFELKVTDSDGLTSTDIIGIIVNPGTTTSCNNRPEIIASLVPIGSLSQARYGLIAGSAGSKIVFAGGWSSSAHSSRVDVYDTITQSWTTAELTIPERDGMAVASVGDKILFAGGGDNDWTDVTSRIDIYNTSTNTWSIAELSQPRNYLCAATLGNKVFFAGGGIWGPISGGAPNPNFPPNASYHIGTKVVDIYDNSNNTWTTAALSEGRFELSATVAGNKIYFAGGFQSIFSGSNKIDVFDETTGLWSTSQLQEVKASAASIAIGNKIFWAAGTNSSYQSGHHLSNQVEIKDLTTGVTSLDCITAKTMFSAVRKNDNIIFFTGNNSGPGNRFDIYNITSNRWSVGVLPVSIFGAAIISINNTIYVAGGKVSENYSNKVWKLEFN